MHAPLSKLWPGRDPLAAKVPEITALFWVVKVLTTGMGEATSDFLVAHNRPVAGVLGLLVFTGALALQLRARHYHAPVYWFAVAMVAVFGTMVADVLHVVLGIPYAISTTVFAVALAVVFIVWHRVEGTLSIHSIVTQRREAFYWAAVLATFALGTAAGDLTAFALHLGFVSSVVLFGAAILVPLVAWRGFGLDPVLAFWTAYVLTRPLGASMADWLGKSKALSGQGYGDGVVAAWSALLIVLLVGYLTVRRSDIQSPARAVVGAGAG